MCNDDVEKVILDMFDEDKSGPHATYIKEGDCLHILTKPDDYYGEMVHPWLTLYRSRETSEVIGFIVHQFRRLATELDIALEEAQ